MAKTKISEFDSNPANNTDIDGINLAEGMAPGLVNNAIRELMAQLKDLQAGLAGDNFTIGGNLTVIGNGTLSGRAIDAFPSGTKMLFQQSSAPVGWTKDTTHNDKALRIVSGAVGTGGSVAFTTAFASQNVGSTALTEANLPAHAHTYSGNTGNESQGHTHSGTTGGQSNDHSHSGTTASENQNHTHGFSGTTGGGGSHSHGVQGGNALAVQGAGGSWFTGSSGSLSYYQFGSTDGVGDHTHGFSGTTGGISNNHQHAFSTGGVSANHTHSFTTGNISVNHTHAFSGTTSSVGSGTGHTHSLNIAVSYVDVIIATKN